MSDSDSDGPAAVDEVDFEPAPFVPPKMQDNPGGWGPVSVPEAFKRLPYQNFNKADKIGKIADWTTALYGYQDRRFGGRWAQNAAMYSSGPMGTQYAYVHDEDDSQFQLVDTGRTRSTYANRANRIKQQQYLKKLVQKDKDRKAQAGYAQAPRGRGGFMRGGFGRGGFMRGRGMGPRYGRGGRYDNQRNAKNRHPSVAVKPDWELIEEFDFAAMQKLNLPGVHGEDIEGECYGTLQMYDRAIDRVSARNEKPLLQGHGVYYRVSTTQDPVIEKLAKQGAGTVFGTDILMAALMACTRSVYSWDIVVHRIADKLFFDRRDNTGWVLAPDAMTVSETANEPPADETGMNSAKMLAQEAVYINQNFRQQVLKQDDTLPRLPFEHAAVPFADEDDKHLSIAYKYRRFHLGTGDDGKERTMVVRCEHDGYMAGLAGDNQLLTIKAFNEWDSKQCGGVDWRKTLDHQRGAVLATELKNNSFRLAKWTLQAMMAGSHQIKFGYVSRAVVKDSARHVILATEHFAPDEFAQTTGLDVANCWGVLRCLVDKCLSQPAGKYLIMKDPNKGALRLYKLPQGEFESEASSGSEDADDEEADAVNEA